MRATVLGSGDAFGSGGRFQTCIALADDAPHAPTHTLLDCGATSLLACSAGGVDPNTVGTVLVSHLHGDHFGGLPFLVLDGQFRRRTDDLTVVGPPGTADRLAVTMEALFPGSSTVERRFAVRVVEREVGEVHRTDRLTATPFAVRHASGAPAYAWRVTDATGTLAYSGDTEWTDTLLDVADGADVFLCEGYAPDPVRWHLDLGALEAHRDRLACGRLVLTHLSPAALAADLSGWEVAHDGLALDVGSAQPEVGCSTKS